jgi:hypothetical protein
MGCSLLGEIDVKGTIKNPFKTVEFCREGPFSGRNDRVHGDVIVVDACLLLVFVPGLQVTDE